MYFVKCKCSESFEIVMVYGLAQNEMLPQQNVLIENVGVNRAPAWIRQPSRVEDSGRDTFEN